MMYSASCLIVGAAQLISTFPLKEYKNNDKVAHGGRLEKLPYYFLDS
jgi:hypothetical protein